MLNMNFIVAKLGLLIAIPFFGMSGFANAQVGNPLRLEAVAVAPKPDQSKPGLLNRRIPRVDSNAPQTQERANANNGMDSSVAHAAYTSVAPNGATEVSPAEIKPAGQTQSLAEMLAEYQNNTAAKRNQDQALNPEVLEANGDSESSSAIKKLQAKRSDQQRIQNLIQSIAWSTCLVLAVGVGFIFSAKLWLGRSNTQKKKQPESPIKIASTLRLSPKANLFLVEAGEQRLIVASDQDGIKSMVALNEASSESKSFAETLQSFSEASDSMAVQGAGLFDQGKSEIKEEAEHFEPTSSETYSLGTVGESKTKAATGNNEESGNEPDKESLESTQRRMEEALNEFGLKDLLVEALQGKSYSSSR